jgi:hypothetical protein
MMLLSQTRRRVAFSLKAFVFDNMGFQDILDQRDKHPNIGLKMECTPWGGQVEDLRIG